MIGQKHTTQIHIAGAGLAGSECALQLAGLGYDVVLYEMRASRLTAAHKTDQCAELVCSNSFGSLAGTSAPGLLKWEAECLGSRILTAAIGARVPAGQALSMDRDIFAKAVTATVRSHPRIRIENRIIESLEQIPRPAVIATGPLTDALLAESMRQHFGDEFLYFFDAIAPIVSHDSINMNIAWRADRWDKGTKDYINCPMSKREYFFFIEEAKAARKTEAKDFEKGGVFFDGCMPIEEMIARGDQTLRFGPMSPKGLKDPRTGNSPFAVVQLRQDNREGTAYNIVGFQTKMAYADQKRVFRLIPGLEDADFLKLGSIHRNLYINTPKRLQRDLSSRKDPWLFFAGQITGVEGYFESTCMGLLVARLLDAKIRGQLALDASNIDDFIPPRETALGSLLNAITDETKIAHFQPTNINFGHLPPSPDVIDGQRLGKHERRQRQVAVAREAMKGWLQHQEIKLAMDSNIDQLAQQLVEATAQATLSANLQATEKLATPASSALELEQ